MTKKEREALRRLKVLQEKGLVDDVVEKFEEDGQVFFSEFNWFAGALYYIEGAPKIVVDKIKELEKNGDVVYHATHEKFEFGECWDLFVITNEDVTNDTYGKNIRDYFDQYGVQFAYVINVDVPEFSEFGSIQVQPKGGGLVRVA